MKNIVIVGTGFSGAYIGRNLAEQGWKVTLLERRNHIGGQMYDYIDEETGCLVHKYGPHIFHTDDDDIYNWLRKFTEFTPYKLKTQVFFEEEQRWFTCSFGFHTIDELYDKEFADFLKASLKEKFPGRDSVTIPELLNAEDLFIREFACKLWEQDYQPYTAKQWGINPEDVDPDILKRVPVFLNYFDKIHNNKYEAIPSEGYTKLFEKIYDHPNITIELNVDAMKRLEVIGDKVYYNGEPSNVLFTGAIDELFNYKHGELGYRSLKFETEVIKNDKDTRAGDPPVDIYPDSNYEYTRITNFGKLPIQTHLEYQIRAKEYSYKFELNKGLERYYPLSTLVDKETLAKYLEDAENVKGLYLAGRLADYKYYDMDKSLVAAREKLQLILEKQK